MDKPYFDALTGLLSSRDAFVEMEAMCSRAAQSGHKVGFIFVEADDFRRFNDIYGLPAGDSLLVKWARVLEGCVEEGIVVARWGGNELVVMVPNCEMNIVSADAENIRVRLAKATIFSGRTCGPLTATLGVACFPDDGTGAKQILDAAEQACVVGKGRGKNCVVAARDLEQGAPPP